MQENRQFTHKNFFISIDPVYYKDQKPLCDQMRFDDLKSQK